MIDRDDINGRQTPLAFRDAGVGQAVLQRCWFCNTNKHQLGGRRVGRLKLFKCAGCVSTTPAKPAMQGVTS